VERRVSVWVFHVGVGPRGEKPRHLLHIPPPNGVDKTTHGKKEKLFKHFQEHVQHGAGTPIPLPILPQTLKQLNAEFNFFIPINLAALPHKLFISLFVDCLKPAL
jgi:hypothetical protein